MAFEASLGTNVDYYILQPAPKQIYCRLCLSDSLTSKYKQVFSSLNSLKTVAEVIGDFAPIEILENDNYSKLICLICFDKLTATEKFKTLITKSDSILRQRFPAQDPLEINKLDIRQIVKDNKDVICQGADIKIKEEFIEIEDNEICEDYKQSGGNKLEDIVQENRLFRQIRCVKCKKNFKNYESRREHYLTHCTPVLKYKCTLCNKGFATKVQCADHEASHKNVMPYQCEKCGKSYKYHRSLEYHKFVHSETKLFKCDKCNKSYRKPSSLREHKKMHLDKSPYECEICQRRYKTELQCRVHKKKVHNPSLVPCQICGKLVPSLTAHMKLHTKPYKCNICDQSFGVRIYLKNHMTTHSEENLYSCAICKKEFRHPSTLKNHLLAHKNKNRFVCELCSRPFSVNALLMRHLKNVHKLENPN